MYVKLCVFATTTIVSYVEKNLVYNRSKSSHNMHSLFHPESENQ